MTIVREPTMERLLEVSDTKSLYLVAKRDIKSKIANWEKNRPEDKMRVTAIQLYNKRFNVHHLDGIVYAWKSDGLYKVYDGWTRYCAADVDTNFILCVDSTENEQDIIYHFIALNSAVPVPSLFLESDMDKKKKTVQTVVNSFCEKYASFQSASRRPQKPNFNRDVFTEQLSQLDIDGVDIFTLEKLIERTNKAIQKAGKDFPSKAINGGLYMFADKKILWQQYFNKELTKDDQSWFSKITSIGIGA